MKKVVKIMLVILSFIALIFLASSLRLVYIHNERLRLDRDIKNSEKKLSNIEEKNKEINESINDLKEAKKEKWEELEIWQKAKKSQDISDMPATRQSTSSGKNGKNIIIKNEYFALLSDFLHFSQVSFPTIKTTNFFPKILPSKKAKKLPSKMPARLKSVA